MHTPLPRLIILSREVRDSSGRYPRVLGVRWGLLEAAVGRRLFQDGATLAGVTRSETSRIHDARRSDIEVVIGDAGSPNVVTHSMRE